MKASHSLPLRSLALAAACAAGAVEARAQAPAAATPADWQSCRQLAGDDAARLACYDRWAGQLAPDAVSPNASAPAPSSPPPPALAAPAVAHEAEPAVAHEAEPADAATPPLTVADADLEEITHCRDRRYSAFSRFWELEDGSSCGTLGLRGYRPLDIAFSIADGRPETPTSPSPDHTGAPINYQPGEMRINLSLRTKIAQNLLTHDVAGRKDSLWFGYTQQSTWQLFNADISRPFRTTDHEPEFMYVYPTDVALPGGWRWRYAGVGLVHQSNGQSLPLSRSWNRVYLMGGVELSDRFHLTARAWKRISESPENDDNPDITRYIGRVELGGWWNPDGKNSVGTTWRTWGKGSVRLEWLRALGDPATSNLRLHAQLFHGYGDTLVDYNRRRTVFSIGLSLVDF